MAKTPMCYTDILFGWLIGNLGVLLVCLLNLFFFFNAIGALKTKK